MGTESQAQTSDLQHLRAGIKGQLSTQAQNHLQKGPESWQPRSWTNFILLSSKARQRLNQVRGFDLKISTFLTLCGL